DAVGVAIERDADIGAHLAHLLAQGFRRDRAAVFVDVEAVGLHSDRDYLGAQFPQRRRRDAVAGAVGAIDDDAQAVEIEPARQRPLVGLDISVVHAVDAPRAAEVAALGETLRYVGLE